MEEMHRIVCQEDGLLFIESGLFVQLVALGWFLFRFSSVFPSFPESIFKKLFVE